MLQDLASKLHQSNGMQNKTLRGPEGFIQPLLRSQSFASALDTRRARPRRALLLYQSDCQTTKMSVERQIFLTHADHCFRLRESCVATLRTDRHQIGLSDRHHRNTHPKDTRSLQRSGSAGDGCAAAPPSLLNIRFFPERKGSPAFPLLAGFQSPTSLKNMPPSYQLLTHVLRTPPTPT